MSGQDGILPNPLVQPHLAPSGHTTLSLTHLYPGANCFSMFVSVSKNLIFVASGGLHTL